MAAVLQQSTSLVTLTAEGAGEEKKRRPMCMELETYLLLDCVLAVRTELFSTA